MAGRETRRRPGAGAPALQPGVAALRALAHPLRLRVMEMFAEAPRTTKQVAEMLGEPPTRLYHHVNALERAGLLRLRETRANRGATEKWYEAVARQITDPGGALAGRRGADARARAGLAAAVLDQGRREVTAALARRGRERPLVVRVIVPASAARLGTIRRRLGALIDELREDGDPTGTTSARATSARTTSARECWALTIALAPIADPKGGDRGRR